MVFVQQIYEWRGFLAREIYEWGEMSNPSCMSSCIPPPHPMLTQQDLVNCWPV